MKTLSSLLFIVILSFSLLAQEDEENNEDKAYSPTIGVGIGTIGFYGDLNDRDYGSPFGGNIAFEVYVIQPIADYLNVKFNFTLGSIRAEERSLARNVNFDSELRAGALFVEYNFDNFLPEERKITPFITAGIEAIEFNPKTDLIGKGAEPYNYWSDGTIRNLPENSPNADIAVLVTRDYDFETDIREAGFNPSTSYIERAIAVPVGAGITMHLNDQFDFRFESIVHFTFTDYMDGITTETSSDFVGSKRGNGRNDHFWYNGFSLSYNFQKVPPADSFERYDKRNNEPIDYAASGNTEDYDGDGVIDLLDNCPNTPRDVEVDTLGCPIDTDGDGVPDFKDEEINSEYPEFANDKGVEVTDDMIYTSYLNYIDSSGAIAEVIERDFRGKGKKQVVYKIKLGQYTQGETPEEMEKFLSLSDLNKIDEDGQTIYAAGNFKSLQSANQRLAELGSQGFGGIGIIKRTTEGKYIPIGNLTSSASTNPGEQQSIDPVSSANNSEESNQVVFRVQLGAFKTKPTQANYKSIPNLLVTESGGYYRYMSGSFDNFNDAASHKVKMSVQGFKGAFVVAYKNGTRVSLRSVGVNPISSDPIIGK